MIDFVPVQNDNAALIAQMADPAIRIVSLARLSDPQLADWIDTACSLANSVVDCILPATGPNTNIAGASPGLWPICPRRDT